jgi:hypothetical protein
VDLYRGWLEGEPSRDEEIGGWDYSRSA